MTARTIFLSLCLVGWWVTPSVAADVSINVSSRETYVGLPVTLEIAVVDRSGSGRANRTPPVMPDVDGLTIESMGPPMVNSQVSIINGRRSARTSLVYRYRITPEREGSFLIPPIRVDAGGIKTITEAVRLSATKSETGDLMFVEISGKRDSVYVGEPIELTLKIWVRPFKDADREISLNEGQMWQMVSRTTNWGQFQSTIDELAQDNKRPAGRRVLRDDAEGTPREYFLYEIDATAYPTAPGQIDAGEVRVVVDYPTEIGRRRDSFQSLFEDSGFPLGGMGIPADDFFRGFGSRLTVSAVRPIVATATVEPIVVKPIPEENRPESYLGAVGRYSISSAAAPRDVRVGDPITLEISVRGDGPMDLVRAPKLADQSDLASNFKVADDDLAGFVDGNRKVFQTTLRPKRDDVTQIPSIEMSYFDPTTGEFVTTRSDPITINVEAGDVLALDAIVADRPATRRATDQPSSESALPFASWLRDWFAPPNKATTLFPPDDILQSRPRSRLFSGAIIGIAIFGPPVAFFSFALFASRGRLTSARRRFDRSIAAAETAGDIGAAVQAYLMQRTGTDVSRDHAIGTLRRSGDSDLAIRVERFFASIGKDDADSRFKVLKDEASEIAASLSQATKRSASRVRVTKAAAMLVLVSAASAHADEITLSPNQKQSLAAQANRLFTEGQFEASADKFQTLVQSGIQNDRLFFNLASAEDAAGRRGHAVANLRKALRIDPANGVYYGQMGLVQPAAIETPTWQTINDRLLSIVRPRTMVAIAVLAWIAFWAVLAVRLFLLPTFRWRAVAVATLFISMIAGGSVAARTVPLLRDDVGVIVAKDVAIHGGDGDEFAVTREIAGAEGRVVTILGQRSGWTQIRTEDGATGWVRDREVSRT